MIDEPERQGYLIRVRLSDAEVERWVMLAESFGFSGELPQGRLVKGSDAYKRAGISFGLEQLLQQAAEAPPEMSGNFVLADPWTPENDQ